MLRTDREDAKLEINLYRATQEGDPCESGSHWVDSYGAATYWQTAGGGCGGPLIVSRVIAGEIMDDDDLVILAEAADEYGPEDGEWLPDWIANNLHVAPDGVVAIRTIDDRGATAFVLV